MNYISVAILAIVQGLAELLPVSSSAHVIVAQRLLGLDPSAPDMTFLLVMLHTGTMFAVLLYFGKRWLQIFRDPAACKAMVRSLVIATAITGFLGLGAKVIIEKLILERWLGYPKGEVEALFKIIPLVGAALFFVGLWIIWSSKFERTANKETLSTPDAVQIGLVQGLCLPLRGFSRSGATISMAMIRGLARARAEEFSFALAVLLTPPVILLELRRLLKSRTETNIDFAALCTPGLVGMVLSFISGYIALKWLSAWLEKGRWKYFGYYCVVFSLVVLAANWMQLI